MKKTLGFLLILLALAILYVGSIYWRVSQAEQRYFGRSILLPLTLEPRPFDGPRLKASHGSRTYVFDRNGERVIVWREKINGFQHVYGSALTTLELGETVSDPLFCANEWVETLIDRNGISLRDRRKDLHHNRLGREIGREAAGKGLGGNDADTWIVRRIFREMDRGWRFIAHESDPRVDRLPSEADLGCPHLPKRGPFSGGLSF